MSSFNAVDVSEWNGDINWNDAYADGVRYAFIRAGFGQDSESQDDKYFHINMENALKAGVKVGVYFYAYATDYDSAVGEAEHCIRLIEPYRDKISFPVFYDIEEQKCVPRIKDIVDGFRNKMEYHGYNVGVYTAISWYDAYFQPIDIDYIWIASWGSDDGKPHTKPQWCDVWQYTSHGSVNGIAKASYYIDQYGNKCYTSGVDCDIVYNENMHLLINQDPIPDPEPEKNIYIDISVPEGCNVYINNQLIDVNKHIEG